MPACQPRVNPSVDSNWTSSPFNTPGPAATIWFDRGDCIVANLAATRGPRIPGLDHEMNYGVNLCVSIISIFVSQLRRQWARVLSIVVTNRWGVHAEEVALQEVAGARVQVDHG